MVKKQAKQGKGSTHTTKVSSTDSGATGGNKAQKKKLGPNSTYSERYLTEEAINTAVPDEESRRVQYLYSRTDLQKCLVDFLHGITPEVGFKECNVYNDIRMVMCVIAWGIALYCLIYMKFPKDSTVIVYAVIVFFIVYTIISIFDFYWVRPDTYIVLRDREENMVLCGLIMDEFTDEVKLEFTGGSLKKNETTTVTKSVARYFDTEGYMVFENVFDDFCAAFEKHCGHLHVPNVPIE